SCWGSTSTATAHAWRNCSTRPARGHPSTSFGPRLGTSSVASPSASRSSRRAREPVPRNAQRAPPRAPTSRWPSTRVSGSWPAAPSGVTPLALIGNDVFCVYDPQAEDAIALEAAYRLARALALAGLRDASVQLDVPAVQTALADIIRQVGEVQGMKVRLTSIS